ncbi:hypothetical protein EWW49_01160 [Pseudomonas syringae]|nr:hypothetical protein EWW49_01160 [Pseudomonas syringae]
MEQPQPTGAADGGATIGTACGVGRCCRLSLPRSASSCDVERHELHADAEHRHDNQAMVLFMPLREQARSHRSTVTRPITCSAS